MESQTAKILKHLLQGNSLTALDALKKFGCLRLSGRIFEIREKYSVKSEMVTLRNKKRVAKYSIVL